MKKGKWSVYYERWDEECSAIGETDDKGAIAENITLSWALMLMGVEFSHGEPYGPNLVYCNSVPPCIRAIRFNEGTRDEIELGIDEQRSLMFPQEIKPEAVQRLCKLLNVR